MPPKHYQSAQQLINELPKEHREIVDELRGLFFEVPHIVEKTRYDHLRYDFPNGMWCYVMSHRHKYPILGVSRGAKMIKMNPLLGGVFDEVKGVVGKIILRDVDTIKAKGIQNLILYINELPQGIGVL